MYYCWKNEFMLSFRSPHSPWKKVAVQVSSSFCLDHIPSCRALLFPLCQPPAVRGFSLCRGHGFWYFPPRLPYSFPIICSPHSLLLLRYWRSRGSTWMSFILLVFPFSFPASALPNDPSACIIPLSTCTSATSSHISSLCISLLPHPPLRLSPPSLLTSSRLPLTICRKH